MSDRVAKVGRPKKTEPQKLTFLRGVSGNSEQYPNVSEYRSDHILWHKEINTSYGLQIKERKDSQTTTPIDGQTKQLESQRWKTYRDINLSEADKQELMKNDQWISDKIINVSQFLLQKEWSRVKGLQNVCLTEIDGSIPLTQMQIKGFEEMVWKQNTGTKLTKEEKKDREISGLLPIESGHKFVQILLDKNRKRNHWICVSNLMTHSTDTVRIYDSDLKRVENRVENYSELTLRAIKRMLYYCEDITIEIPFVCQQKDNISGGVFAIAFATALCFGEDPAAKLFSHCPKALRSYLLECLELGTMKIFPAGKDRNICSTFILRSIEEKLENSETIHNK